MSGGRSVPKRVDSSANALGSTGGSSLNLLFRRPASLRATISSTTSLGFTDISSNQATAAGLFRSLRSFTGSRTSFLHLLLHAEPPPPPVLEVVSPSESNLAVIDPAEPIR